MAEDKIPVTVIMPRKLKAQLQKLSEAEDRSLSNYMLRVLMDHVEAAAKKK